jgi:hypothetical protein
MKKKDMVELQDQINEFEKETRRTKDVVTNTWKTLEWIHAETGIAYGFDKKVIDSQPDYYSSQQSEMLVNSKWCW